MRRSVLLCLSLVCASVHTARSAPEANPVVVQVGETAVRAREFAGRLALMEAFERESYGKTPAEVRKNYIERRLLPELLEAEEARRRGMQQNAVVRQKTNTLLAAAVKESVMAEVDAKLTDAEIQRFCETSKTPAEDTRGAPRDCGRDLLSYRIALRREKAFKQLTALQEELTRTLVKARDDQPVQALIIPEQGPPLVAAEPKAK